MPIFNAMDATINYQLTGQGPPVVLIQGVGLGGCGWQPQVTGLKDRYHLLTFDNRGISGDLTGTESVTIEQMAADVRALLDEVGWQSAHVVGHSMGGLIAQQFALSWPHRVRSLALLCTFSQGKEGAGATPWMIWVGIRSRIGTAKMRRAAFLEIVVPADDLQGVDREELAAKYAPIFGHDLAEQPPIVMRQVRAMSRHDKFERLTELASIHTLVVTGQYDRLALPKYGRRLAEKIANARYVELPNAAHGAPITCSDNVNDLLIAHFSAAEANAFVRG